MVQEPSCYVCLRFDNLDSHHLKPIAYNGPLDGPQIMLCAICHRNVHTAANLVYKGRQGFIELFTPAEFERARILIQCIVNAKIQMESSGRKPDTVRRLMIQIPHSLHIDLHRKKQDLGFTNLQDFIIQVLKQAVK
jgi:hypothetical protein